MLNIDKEVWKNTEAKEFGDYESLELGGHACIIINADIYKNSMTGNKSLRIQVDIDKSDKQAGFFKKQFDNNTNAEKKWSNGATKYYSLKEENLGMLKGLTTAVENSNAGFKFDMDESKLIGKKIAGVFGLEEFEKQDGSVGTATKLVQIRSLDKLKEIKWNLSGVCPEDITEAKNTWFYSASFINKFVASVKKIVDSEKLEANNYLNFFNLLFDNHFDEQTIDVSIKETQDFLKFINEQLNLGYKVEDYISLNDTKASKILSKELENLNRLMAVNEHSEMLCLFSMNPFDKVTKYFDTFVKLNLLLEDKHNLFSASVDNESKDKIAEHKKNITTKIGDMVCNLDTIGGASNGNN